MPNYRRLFVPGASYFFTVVTADRAPILVTDQARACLRRAFVAAKARWPFEIPNFNCSRCTCPYSSSPITTPKL
jgi:putative transposase